MRSLLAILMCTFYVFADNYISGSVIINSTINGGRNIGKKGSGLIINKTIDLKKEFDRIDVNAPAEVIIHRSPKNTIVIRTDDNLVDSVSVYIRGRTLFVRIDGSINPTNGILININSKLLNLLTVNGASDVKVQNYTLKKLKVNLNGASDISFDSNRIDEVSIRADGSYDINLLNSKVQDAYIEASGSGNIQIDVSNVLNVSIGGTVEVRYRGNPKVKKSIGGVAELIKIK
jgi:sRNA-binding carbon storage regulator CsrA